jgi:hypothetical protein
MVARRNDTLSDLVFEAEDDFAEYSCHGLVVHASATKQDAVNLFLRISGHGVGRISHRIRYWGTSSYDVLLVVATKVIS